jgi:ATP-dependent Clp protease ATP-binding subunit ClpB
MVGVGKGEGFMDVSNMLKPALARGDLQLVSTITLDEYHMIEKDATLARRFQSVYVAEPGVEDTSDIYIYDRFQPDKSIDLINGACSRLANSY